MPYIDTHAHLYLNQFDNDINQIVKRAKEESVEKCILPNIDSGSISQLEKLVSTNKNYLFPAMGLHPTSVKQNYKEELKIIEEKVYSGNWIAIGEMGIDLYWDKTYLQQQIEAFHMQIDWALDLNLPIIIHARDSLSVILAELEKRTSDKISGVFHCFLGTLQEAQKVVEMGFYLGIGGVLTFKKSGLDEILKSIDISRIVLETDAPFLAPVPFRGKRNEPSYVKYVAEKISEIKNETIDQIGEITSQNACQLFNFTL